MLTQISRAQDCAATTAAFDASPKDTSIAQKCDVAWSISHQMYSVASCLIVFVFGRSQTVPLRSQDSYAGTENHFTLKPQQRTGQRGNCLAAARLQSMASEIRHK